MFTPPGGGQVWDLSGLEAEATQTIVLLPQEGNGINLDLDEKLVHILARLLQQAAVAAEWGLALDISPQASLSGASATGQARRLH